MKRLFFILSIVASMNIFGQSGVYVYGHPKDVEKSLKWTLSLNEDGTFLYHFYRKGGIPAEENFYGKGTWWSDKNSIIFQTNKETDMDEKHTMDFTNSKARYITKSPRDKSDKVVKTALRFYASEIPYIIGLNLLKE
ncbi:hypothetical protein [Mariniflexile sp.]|uniref:hypothetical protein n=1 Tax=Mariniflexile sp. TaxID=1979402 RepID=UPI0035657363